MNSGVYVGDVESYAVVDVNGGYRVPGYKGFIISATINNLLNNKHQEWIGAPELGILGLLKVQFEM
jgi:iron complex outermembrane receptor protein